LTIFAISVYFKILGNVVVFSSDVPTATDVQQPVVAAVGY